MDFKFEILKKSKKSKARIAKIFTPYGEILTPAFLPVATLGTIKGGLFIDEFLATKAQAKIVSSFHFLDLDAVDIVKKAGGLHKFLNFQKPIFTDSGGFQVFSLGRGMEFGFGKIISFFPGNNFKKNSENSPLVKKLNEEGVKFISPRDGREIFLTPEKSAKSQKDLGADFIYLLDICGTPFDNYKRAKREMEITNLWAKRFLEEKIPKNQRVFGIIQGGLFKDLREKATKFINNLPVFGIAIGGALGKTKKEMFKTLKIISDKIDSERPCHLLGIGSPDDLEKTTSYGIDIFDCVLPTRLGRHGIALTNKGLIDIKKKNFKRVFKPIERDYDCFTCQNYNLSQLNFFFKAGEQIAGRLLTIHNLSFMERNFEKIREKIERGKI